MKNILKIISITLFLLTISIHADIDNRGMSQYALGVEKNIETLDFTHDFPELKMLFLRPGENVKDAVDDMGLSKNFQLEAIWVDGPVFGKVLSFTHLPNLDSLYIEGNVKGINFPESFPNLREITFSYYFDCAYETLESLSRLSRLEKLYIDFPASLPDDESIELFARFQNLRQLVIHTRENVKHIKHRLKVLLPNTEVLVGFRI